MTWMPARDPWDDLLKRLQLLAADGSHSVTTADERDRPCTECARPIGYSDADTRTAPAGLVAYCKCRAPIESPQRCGRSRPAAPLVDSASRRDAHGAVKQPAAALFVSLVLLATACGGDEGHGRRAIEPVFVDGFESGRAGYFAAVTSTRV